MGEGDGPRPTADLLDGASWECAAAPPGAVAGPDALDAAGLTWVPAVVPGTVAGAYLAAGRPLPDVEALDGQDWWFRCRVEAPVESPPVGWALSSGGLATLADVWLDGVHLLSSTSMFATHRVDAPVTPGTTEVVLRFAALTPVLAARRPRPRWKWAGLTSQNLRWLRTTLLGRQSGWAEVPAPVGPWRPLALEPVGEVAVVSRRVLAVCPPRSDGPGPGSVTVTAELTGATTAGDGPQRVELVVDGRRATLAVASDGGRTVVHGALHLDAVDRWWPHTHGDQPLYPVVLDVDGVAVDLGEVGFRTVETDRADGGFRLVVNGTPVFCRGAGWYPVDPVGYDDGPGTTVELARAAGMNMLRIPGGTVYEGESFFRACDRAGILVWQDLMVGPVDPPDDQAFLDSVRDEAEDVLGRAGAHPSLAVVCGGQQVEEQPAMAGLDRERWHSPVVHEVLPAMVANLLPGTPYLSSSPSGGDVPFEPGAGVCHYFGVGVARLPLSDLRRSAPRFVAEGLATSVPPGRVTMDEEFGGALPGALESGWATGVHRDAGSWFDLATVRDHYASSLWSVDVGDLWRYDPERALDLGRAAAAEIAGAAVAEWRRPDSPCAGMLYIALRDMAPGPGWGLVDASGRPKAPWYVLRRGFAPLAVLVTDEGLNGLAVHVVNDGGDPVAGTVVVGLHTDAHLAEEATHPVRVPARGAATLHADALFDGFRDLSWAYRFGPRPFDLVTVELRDPSGTVLADTSFLPGGPVRPADPDPGLQATTVPADGGVWQVTVSSRRFAQYVQLDVPGHAPDDSWFHLAPESRRTVLLRPVGPGTAPPRGRVRALNTSATAPVTP